jgi:hypothetical protein
MKIRFISTIFLCLFSFFLRAQDSIKTVELKHWKEHVLYDDSLYGKLIESKFLIKKGMEKKLAEFLFLAFNPDLKADYQENPEIYKGKIENMMEPTIYEIHAGNVIWEIWRPSDRYVKDGWNSYFEYIPLSKIEAFLKD